MRINPLSSDQQQRAKAGLLAQLASTGQYSAIDMLGLMARDFDSVLDEAFRFTDAVRLRVADDRVVTIFPGSTLQ